jgi:hypothetical protein
MSDSSGTSQDQDNTLENFAAELTCAIYSIALRQGMSGSWIKVQLGLWTALIQTVEKWAREQPPNELKVLREGLMVELTESAFHIVVKSGVKGSLLEVELRLYRAIRLVIGRHHGARLRAIRSTSL